MPFSHRSTGKLDNKTTFNSFNPEFSDTDTLNGVFKVEWDLDDFTLTSLTGYSEYENEFQAALTLAKYFWLTNIKRKVLTKSVRNFALHLLVMDL